VSRVSSGVTVEQLVVGRRRRTQRGTPFWAPLEE
jgi:hypothetical protein